MSSAKLVAILLLAPLGLPAQDLKDFEKRVTEFTLANGLHFIVLERHEAPVVSFHTYVNAGSVDDPEGETGLAHMFEHMAFKGTETIGSKNWPEEKKALDAIEDDLRPPGRGAPQGAARRSEEDRNARSELKAAIEKAASYVVPNLYPTIIEENGGVGMNAGTCEDSTDYFYNLPSNRIELWFLLESERFLHPVFREFYKERDVVREERRMRVESSPQGKLVEALLATAFAAHPYRHPPSGWASDIEHLRVRDAAAVLQDLLRPGEHHHRHRRRRGSEADPRPGREVFRPPAGRPAAAAGPHRGAAAGWPASSRRSSLPPSRFDLIAYKRPDQYDKDDPVFDVISGILAGGTHRHSLQRHGSRQADFARLRSGGRPPRAANIPNLFLFFVVPSLGHTVEENEKAWTRLSSISRTKRWTRTRWLASRPRCAPR